MEHHRRIAYTCFDIKQHLVWITQYRKQLLWEEVVTRLRQIVREHMCQDGSGNPRCYKR